MQVGLSYPTAQDFACIPAHAEAERRPTCCFRRSCSFSSWPLTRPALAPLCITAAFWPAPAAAPAAAWLLRGGLTPGAPAAVGLLRGGLESAASGLLCTRQTHTWRQMLLRRHRSCTTPHAAAVAHHQGLELAISCLPCTVCTMADHASVSTMQPLRRSLGMPWPAKALLGATHESPEPASWKHYMHCLVQHSSCGSFHSQSKV